MSEWIPIKMRPMTDEEKAEYLECGDGFIYDCRLPDDGDEVLITTVYGSVVQTTFYNDYDYGCYFEMYEDEDEVLAWMPLPKPYKKD